MKVVLATWILLLVYVSVNRTRRKKLGTVPSPCRKGCRIEDGLCVGCKRTLDEIRDWMVLSDYEQKKLLHELMWRKDNG